MTAAFCESIIMLFDGYLAYGRVSAFEGEGLYLASSRTYGGLHLLHGLVPPDEP